MISAASAADLKIPIPSVRFDDNFENRGMHNDSVCMYILSTILAKIVDIHHTRTYHGHAYNCCPSVGHSNW